MQHMPQSSRAIEIMIRQQREFCEWWREHVTVGYGPGRGKKNRVPGSFSVAEAEASTGVMQQQISRWNQGLGNEDAYRWKITQAACIKAGIEPPENHRAEGAGDNEWHTPPEYMLSTRHTLSGRVNREKPIDRSNSSFRSRSFWRPLPQTPPLRHR
jgi:hypothetical protein